MRWEQIEEGRSFWVLESHGPNDLKAEFSLVSILV